MEKRSGLPARHVDLDTQIYQILRRLLTWTTTVQKLLEADTLTYKPTMCTRFSDRKKPTSYLPFGDYWDEVVKRATLHMGVILVCSRIW